MSCDEHYDCGACRESDDEYDNSLAERLATSEQRLKEAREAISAALAEDDRILSRDILKGALAKLTP